MNYSLQKLLQRLPELDARLRAAEFTVSPDRWQSLYDLIYRLQADDKLPDDIEQLARLIAPLFCNNSVEQQSFYALFRHWAQGDVESRNSEEIVQTSAIAATRQQNYQKKSRQLPVTAIVFVLLLFAGALIYFMTRPPEIEQPAQQDVSPTLQTIASQQREITPEPVVEQKKDLQPIPPRQPPEPLSLDASRQSDLLFAYYLLLGLPLIFLIAWWLRRWWRIQVVQNFHRNLGGDPLMYLKLKQHKTLPFGWGEFSRRLKRGGSVQTRKLDIVKTIDKTIHKAGLFTPVMHTHDPNPAYLVLVNRSNARDHTADRADRLIERLQHAKVTVYRFEYHDDPQLCFSVGQNRKSHSLSQLARHYAGCRLLLIGDGEALLDPFSGSLQRWVRQFDSWEPRILLTPAAQPWDARESQIAHSGFAVAPFQVHGMEAVSDWLLKPSIDASVWFTREGSDPYPELFEVDEDEWLSSTPPQDYDAQTTCSTLYDYLGQSGYRLLAACAAYPRLVSMLTITLDQILFPSDNGNQREQRLVRLSRLPWFRHGSMPDYLRADLLDRVSEPVLERINEAYQQIFARINEIPGRQASGLFSRAQAGSFRHYLRDLVLFAPADSPMADSLFADVMLSEKHPEPNWMIGQKLARLLPRKRYRAWPADLVAGLCVIAAVALHFAWSWADPMLQQEMMAQMKAGYADVSVQISSNEDTRALGDALEEVLQNYGFGNIERRYAPPLDLQVKLDEKQREAIVSAQLPFEDINSYLGGAMQGLSLRIDGEEYRLDSIPIDAAQNVRDAINEASQLTLAVNREVRSLHQSIVSALSVPTVNLDNTPDIENVMRREVLAWSGEIGVALYPRTLRESYRGEARVVEQPKIEPSSRSATPIEQLREIINSRLPEIMMQALVQPAREIVQAYNQALNDALAKAGNARDIPDAIVYLDGYQNAAQTVQQRLAYLGYGSANYPLLKDQDIVLKSGDSGPVHLSVNLSQPLAAGGIFRDEITLQETPPDKEPQQSKQVLAGPECDLENFADFSYRDALERLNSSGCFSIDRNSSQLAQNVRELLNEGDIQSYLRALTGIQQELETKQGGNSRVLTNAIVRLKQDISDQPSPPQGLKRAWNLGNRLDRLPEAVDGIDLQENLLQEKCSLVSAGNCDSEFAAASDLVRAIHLVNAVIDSYAVQSQQEQQSAERISELLASGKDVQSEPQQQQQQQQQQQSTASDPARSMAPARVHGQADQMRCPDGQFADPNGNCYSCPAGYVRTAEPVTSNRACVETTAKATLIEPEMVVIPAGTFVMGSPQLEKGRSSDESPQHEVQISSFALGKTEVTFDEYDRFADATGRTRPRDQGWGRGNRPVFYVSWNDAVAYAEWLSEQTGKRYRLPTEAEWEYAARAGSTTRFHFGDDETMLCDYANVRDRSYDPKSGIPCDDGVGKQNAAVASYKLNNFGLHDMHGNVSEWTQDCWHGNYEGAPGDGGAWLEANGGDCALRVIRGGGWDYFPQDLRSAYRGWTNTDGTNYNLGFRLARDL